MLKEFDVKLQIREKKADKLQKMRFDCTYNPIPNRHASKSIINPVNGQVYLKINEVYGDQR